MQQRTEKKVIEVEGIVKAGGNSVRIYLHTNQFGYRIIGSWIENKNGQVVDWRKGQGCILSRNLALSGFKECGLMPIVKNTRHYIQFGHNKLTLYKRATSVLSLLQDVYEPVRNVLIAILESLILRCVVLLLFVGGNPSIPSKTIERLYSLQQVHLTFRQSLARSCSHLSHVHTVSNDGVWFSAATGLLFFSKRDSLVMIYKNQLLHFSWRYKIINISMHLQLATRNKRITTTATISPASTVTHL